MIGTLLERDPALGTRSILTDEELARKVKTGPPNLWEEHGKPSRQASLVVDPPNGRIPPLTSEAQMRVDERNAALQSRACSYHTRRLSRILGR
jgi:hypothetical protein